MKKILILGVVVLAISFFAGCSRKPEAQKESIPAVQEEKKTEKTINSIFDAMSLGEKMKCSYTIAPENDDEESGIITSEVYLEGMKYKSVSEIEGQGKVYALSDGKDVYTWAEQSKQGMKIGEDCYSDAMIQGEEGENVSKPEEEKTPEDVFNSAFNVHCEKVDSIDWALPQDIKFSDQCELIKVQIDQMEQMQKQIPGGFDLPEGVKLPEGVEMPQ